MAHKHLMLKRNDGITNKATDLVKEVKILQQVLKDWGVYPANEPIDGEFGSKTEQAVKDFQSKQALKVDGVAGRNTWAALLKVSLEEIEIISIPIFNGSEEDLNAVIGVEKTTPVFREKVVEIAARLQTKPIFLMAVMSFESGGTFSPSVKNQAGSGATGLIQFMPSTAQDLGTSTLALAQMSAVKQLDYVEKYFQPYSGRLSTLEDTYMAVLYPAAIGRGSDYVLFKSPSTAYMQNNGLDINGDGLVTVAEAANAVKKHIR